MVTMQAEHDEAVNGVEAVRAEASELLAELVAFRACTELETVKGKAYFLREQVALLGTREAELLFKCEAAWGEVTRLQIEPKAL
ncbi:hypothetical protein ACLOJK_011907 [Asimina triloba]